MAGWEISNEEIYVERIEEIVDTNPDLYKQRTIVALSERRYTDAITEAEWSLRYGNNELQYQVLKTRVLYEAHRFSDCLRYILTSDVWKKRESAELLDDECDFIYVAFAECFHACGGNPNQLDFVIVTPSGNGVYSNIQEAIKQKKPSQRIFLTTGAYHENLAINQDVEITSSIRCRPEIKADYAAFCVNNGTLKMSNLTINMDLQMSAADCEDDSEKGTALTVRRRGRAEIENIQFKVSGFFEDGMPLPVFDLSCESNLVEKRLYNVSGAIAVEGGYCWAKNIHISNAGVGVLVTNSGNIEIVQSVIEKLPVGIMPMDGKCKVKDSEIQTEFYGIMNMGDEAGRSDVTCEKVIFKGAYVGVCSGRNDSKIRLEGCTVQKNKLGCIICTGKCDLINTKILSNKHCNLLATSVAEVFARNTTFAGSQGYGIQVDSNAICELEACEIKDNLTKAIYKNGNGKVYMDSKTKELNNDIAGWIIGGIGRFFESL